MKWAIVIEKSGDGYGGYVPDLPGIGVVGDTPDEVRGLLSEAIDLYLEESGKQEERAPSASAMVEYVEAGKVIAM